MSYCPEHGHYMEPLNPHAYDGLIYSCPDGEAWVWADGQYTLCLTVADAQQEFGIDLADTEKDGSPSAFYCVCGHIGLDHPQIDLGYYPCSQCNCEDFALVEDDSLPHTQVPQEQAHDEQ